MDDTAFLQLLITILVLALSFVSLKIPLFGLVGMAFAMAILVPSIAGGIANTILEGFMVLSIFFSVSFPILGWFRKS